MFVNPLLASLDYVQFISKYFEGFKIYSHAGGFSYDSLLNNEIIDSLLSNNKPILFHTSKYRGSIPSLLEPLIKKANGYIIIAHCGALIHKDLKKIAQYSNVFIDVSPLQTLLSYEKFIDKKLIVANLTINDVLYYLEKLLGNNIIWGSDAPWSINLLEKGYEKEVEVLDHFEIIGLSNSLNNYFN